MKKLTAVLVLGVTSALLFTGCVPITYTRSVIVHKDANGTVTGTDEIESITESHQEGPKVQEVKGPTTFKYLK
jgi:hypothetical protein